MLSKMSKLQKDEYSIIYIIINKIMGLEYVQVE